MCQQEPTSCSSENSSINSWNWNWNNQNWNNNNKNNSNSVFFARDYTEMHRNLPIELDDIYQAYVDCRKRKKNKKGSKEFEEHAIYNCARLVDEINSFRYRPRSSQCFIILYPTAREVFCAVFRDRVVQHFVYNELNPIIERLIIQDTCSCRVGKGTDYAIRRVQRKARQISENFTRPYWIYKIDLSGFFMSIDREWLCERIVDVIDRYYEGDHYNILKYLVRVIILNDVTKNAILLCDPKRWELLPARKTLFGNDRGLAIGNITSQLFANYSLNDVDHYAKSRHIAYVRFVDDIWIADIDKRKLIETKEKIEKILERQFMKLNNKKSIIQRGEYGVPFLGVTVKPYYSILSKQRINRMYKCSYEFRDPYEAYRSIATRKGMIERYHGRNICKRWFNSIDEEMRKDIRLQSDMKVVWVGEPKTVDNRRLLCLNSPNWTELSSLSVILTG